MIYRYRLSVDTAKPLTAPKGYSDITIRELTRISWETTPENGIVAILIDIFGRDIQYLEDDVILSDCPEIEAEAYSTSVFLANSILMQTGIEPLDPVTVLDDSPELIGENDLESHTLATHKKRRRTTLSLSSAIQGRFSPNKYTDNIKQATAVAHFANGLRTREPTIKFEQFYKVLEAVFNKAKNEEAPAFDSRVSAHISSVDPRFDDRAIKELRDLRNRCAHPNASLGHLSPDDLLAVKEIRSSLPRIMRLARLSIDNPPP